MNDQSVLSYRCKQVYCDQYDNYLTLMLFRSGYCAFADNTLIDIHQSTEDVKGKGVP